MRWLALVVSVGQRKQEFFSGHRQILVVRHATLLGCLGDWTPWSLYVLLLNLLKVTHQVVVMKANIR
jgi:hypothetical protein